MPHTRIARSSQMNYDGPWQRAKWEPTFLWWLAGDHGVTGFVLTTMEGAGCHTHRGIDFLDARNTTPREELPFVAQIHLIIHTITFSPRPFFCSMDHHDPLVRVRPLAMASSFTPKGGERAAQQHEPHYAGCHWVPQLPVIVRN